MKQIKKLNPVFIWIILPFVLLTSFTTTTEKTKQGLFTIVYVDNSKVDGTSGLSSAMVDYISTSMDSISQNPFLLYISNNSSPQYTKNPAAYKQVLNKLSEGSSSLPNCIEDKKLVWAILKREDVKKYAAINVYFFLTENYLKNTLMNETPGYLLNFFPKELALISNLDEQQINVNVYYSAEPKSKNPLTENEVKKAVHFYNINNYQSNIQYHIFSKK